MWWRPEMSAYATSAPAYAGVASRRAIAIFLGLFIIPGVAQSVLLTVVPLEALRLLGTVRAVTLLYVVAGLAALIGRLSIPLLAQQIQRRLVFSLGASLLFVSCLGWEKGNPSFPSPGWERVRARAM